MTKEDSILKVKFNPKKISWIGKSKHFKLNSNPDVNPVLFS